jgi:O-antigen ligase
VIGIARTVNPDKLMHLLSWCAFVSAIASVVLIVVAPRIAFVVGDKSGALNYNGIFPHKNFFGQVMATGALTTLHGIRVARGRYPGKLFMLATFLAMAYASGSTGALLAAALFCGVSGIDSLLRTGGPARVLGRILAVSLVAVIVINVAAPDLLLTLIGKDPTLTGRIEIWSYVIDDIRMRPWLGWGYFGFWQISNPASLEIANAMHWIVPNAHNGLLEFLINVGVVGTALFAGILIRTMVLAFRCIATPQRALAISTISCCLGILVIGVSETVLLAATQPLTPVMFMTGLLCERTLSMERQRRRVQDVRPRTELARRHRLQPSTESSLGTFRASG